MQFTARLRAPIMQGKITSTLRIWKQPRAKVGGRYPVGPGAIEVTSIRRIELADVTPMMAREMGFEGLVDLLKVAKHGAGENVYLIEFKYREVELRSAQTRRSRRPRR
jgi:hypothetical protein